MDEKPLDRFPDFLRTDIAEAIRILSGFGAQRIYLFGSSVTSAAEDEIHDLDIAVMGLPESRFFRAYGALAMTLIHPFDLVDLNSDTAFVRVLKESGQLERVA